MYKEVIITGETMVCLVEMLTEYQVSPDLTLVHMHYLLWGRSWASRPPCWSVGRDPPGTHWPWRRTVQTGPPCQSRSCPQCCHSPACPLSGLCSSWLFPSLSYKFSRWFIIIRKQEIQGTFLLNSLPIFPSIVKPIQSHYQDDEEVKKENRCTCKYM